MRPPFRAGGRTAVLDPAATRIDNDYYDGVGDGWWDLSGPFRGLHEMNPVRLDYVDRTVRTVLAGRDRADVRMLDVGCGGGILTEPLARLGYRVTGVDPSEGALAAARRHAGAAGIAVDYRAGSAYALDAGDSSVDCVVMSDVLEHLHDLPRAVSELARVLRPGGVLAFDTINRTAKSYLVMILLAERVFRLARPRTHAWSMFVTPAELRSLLGGHGLRVRELVGLVPARPIPAAAVHLVRRGSLGGFATGPDLSVSYLGHAVKEGAR